MVEVWKAVGMDLTRVEFLNSSEEINSRPNEYWTLVRDRALAGSLAAWQPGSLAAWLRQVPGGGRCQAVLPCPGNPLCQPTTIRCDP
jgi:hypothetical protein